MAKFIEPGASVLELGAGLQCLRKYLPENCDYQACDLIRREPNDILCDFNKNQYPVLSKKYDYAVGAGLLEYIYDLPLFMSKIKSYADEFVFSYAVCDQASNRRWKHLLSRDEILKIFTAAGLLIQTETEWEGQKIFHLVKSPQPS
ncbi:MAG: hypothetical protein PHS88_02070 [Candidatus Omnitrophica bacterium]|nr:hypothetical protein [Candidatus Omnitrophota bacterium]